MTKSDKYMGVPSVAERRAADPAPPRATPAVGPKHGKPYGYSYVWASWLRSNKERRRSYQWFGSEAARDQSFDVAVGRKHAFMADFKKEQR